MRIILHNRSFYVLGAIGLIGIALWLLVSVTSSKNIEYTTTVVERGDVLEIVSVSGVVEAENTAELAFPIGGIVNEVLVTEGQTVVAGETLITQQQASLQADRRDAVATLLTAQADRDELINGPRSETRDVTATQVAIAEEELARIIAEQAERVANAEKLLNATGLEAYVVDTNDDDVIPPVITGTYNCTEIGSYTLRPFSSGTNLSFRISGLESGTYTGSTDQSSALGACGLRVQFVTGQDYRNTEWTIPVPNTSASSYTTNLNALNLTKQQAQNAVEAAEQALDLALKEQLLENADPRDEALRRSNAAVMQAEARLAAVDANIADRTITAPFAGVITDIDILPGETVTTAPVVTLLASNEFELTARIPEIDITKIAAGQTAEVHFDASRDEIIFATIAFISPIATEIDGVAYFEATLSFTESPEWIRSGLNADVDIIVDQQIDVVRVPKRFISTTVEAETTVLRYRPENSANQRTEAIPITVEFIGNNGYVAVSGLNAGEVIAAP